jgi:hypothetical protein
MSNSMGTIKLRIFYQPHWVLRYGQLVAEHFMVSTLNQLPAHMQSLADENPNMPSMSRSTQNLSNF